MKKTTYELRNELKGLNEELEVKRSLALEKAIANESKEVEEIEKRIADMEVCKATIEKEIQRRASQVKAKDLGGENLDPNESMLRAKASFIRGVIKGEPINEEVREKLKSLPITTDTNTGAKFLPSVLSNELVHEPMGKNPLRGNSTFTNIGGLEIPRISFTIDDDNFIDDDATAKEIKLKGDKLTFDRNKFKIMATISDSTLNGSDVNLISYVENALRSGIAIKEKKIAFASSGKTSFYDTSSVKVKKVEGETMFDAIINAIADLPEEFRESAKVCMKYADYVKMIKELSNGNASLYGVQPEQIIGKPTIFCDSATTPIVGDFSYSQFNYDGNVIYDTGKDLKTGDHLFVLTGWFDHQLKLASAFRLVDVKKKTSGN